MKGAASATATIAASSARPRTASLLSANSEARRRHGDCSGCSAAGSGLATSAAMRMSVGRRGAAQAHARIEHGIEHVDHEIYRDENGDDDQQVGHDDGAGELVERIDEELSPALPPQDPLRHEGE